MIDSIMILKLLFGIALFLFGMNLMSEHIRKIAGAKSELMLFKLTDKPIKGVAIGAIITALIQSSGAVSAMSISLVEGGIIGLERAIAIILGTIAGTSITGWIVAYSSLRFTNTFSFIFSPSVLSAFFAIVGIIFKNFVKNRRIKRIGEIFLGFSVLMLGIDTITQAVEPLKNNAVFIQNLGGMESPLLLFLIGIAVAAVFQSASAAVGILQTISITGVISLKSTVPLLLGIGIGASLPVILVAVGKSANARRCAFSYFAADTIGAIIVGIIYYLTIWMIDLDETAVMMTPLIIALINTIYRLIIVIALFPQIPLLQKITRRFIKTKADAVKREDISPSSL